LGFGVGCYSIRVFVTNNGVIDMRFLMITGAAALLLLPITAPAQACGAGQHAAQAVTADYSAATKKKPVKKVVKKTKKKKAPKVEYMRAAPMK
jgi:hypothetical protein